MLWGLRLSSCKSDILKFLFFKFLFFAVALLFLTHDKTLLSNPHLLKFRPKGGVGTGASLGAFITHHLVGVVLMQMLSPFVW